MKRLLSACGLIIFSLSLNAQESIKLSCEKSESVITYYMNHPLHAFSADNRDVTCIILCDKEKKTVQKVAVLVKVASFDSKNANRDSHVIEETEGIKYPLITFTSTGIKQEGDSLTVSGNLTFHGITRPVTFECEKSSSGTKMLINGSFTIKLTDYMIDPPKLVGVAVDDELKVKFSVVF